MPSVNKVILIGNVTRDPDVKYTPKGTAVTEVGIAMNRVYTTESGEKREEVTFVEVTLWGRQAELAHEHLKKGRLVYFEGRLQLDSWEDKQSGQRRTRLRVVGEVMQFLSSRTSSGEYEERSSTYLSQSQGSAHALPSSQAGQSYSPSGGSARPRFEPEPSLDEESDNIPF